ncbi:hypothetical protein C2E23DRAFT_808663 [Lenzites betulinus]|nr:hypothetical protein C2E23DRAFT_808663 [Lenzites betulinus]
MSAHVLLTSEIAQAVLDQLEPGPLLRSESVNPVAVKERRERQHALAQLATVCRDVSWIALDVLWRHIDAVHHLLFALRPYHHRQHMFTDSIEDEDWARFQEYAQRVRGLCVHDVRSLHATVWVVLTQRCPRGPLLPRLENLAGFTIDTSSVCYMMFLSPSLKRLGLTVCGEERIIIQMVVRAIQPSLRSVQHLVLHDLSYNPWPTILFWELTQLHTLQVEGPNRCALRMQELACLGSFQHLRTLQMRIASISALEGPTATAMGFHSLRELKLSGHLGDICAFIVAAAPPSLELLSIHVHSLCQREDVEDEPHLQSVSPNGVRSLAPIYAKLTPSLRRFEANLRCNCDYVNHFPDSDALLVPLQATPELRSISFVLGAIWHGLGNETRALLQHAWPDLVEFEYSLIVRQEPPRSHSRDGQASTSTDDDLTIQTLALFAHAHPHLTRLTIPSLDLRAVPDISTVPLLDHGLQHLSFSALEADIGLFPFARALDMLFPRLDLSGATNLVPNMQNKIERNAELQLLLLALQTGHGTGLAGAARLEVSSTVAGKRPAGRSPFTIQLLRRSHNTAVGHSRGTLEANGPPSVVHVQAAGTWPIPPSGSLPPPVRAPTRSPSPPWSPPRSRPRSPPRSRSRSPYGMVRVVLAESETSSGSMR